MPQVVRGASSLAPVYAFARRPLWILSHVLVVALLVAMAGAGVWQLQRHNQKQELATVIDDRADAQVKELDLVLTDETGEAEFDAIEFTHVILRGRWIPEEQVTVRNRSLGGSAGLWVITPLDLGNGTAVAVNRGFVPSGVEIPEAPEGEAELTGFLQKTQTRERIGPTDPSDGTLDTLSRVDLERLDQQTQLPLLGAWVQMEESAPPAPDRYPELLPRPTTDGGPSHLSYAGQWFVFTLIGLIGYPLVLRRIARGQGRADVPDWDAPIDRRDDDPPAPGAPPAAGARTMKEMVRPAAGGERWN